MPLWMCPLKVSLLKYVANITLCEGRFLMSIMIWSSISSMRCSLLRCEAMYRFNMSSWIRGFFAILWALMYGEMLLGVGILVLFMVEWMSLCILASTPFFGGFVDINWLPLWGFVPICVLVHNLIV